jgi:hypothetical protein
MGMTSIAATQSQEAVQEWPFPGVIQNLLVLYMSDLL